jgi:hypothetical protein
MPSIHDLELYIQLARVLLDGLKLLGVVITTVQGWYRAWRGRRPLQSSRQRSTRRSSPKRSSRRRARR